MVAWKLFEEYGNLPPGDAVLPLPRTLVHGLPAANGARSRILELDTWHDMEKETPGFNLFPDRKRAVKYLPRFRVRAPRLVLCKVEVLRLYKNPRSSYYFTDSIMIRRIHWLAREKGSTILSDT